MRRAFTGRAAVAFVFLTSGCELKEVTVVDVENVVVAEIYVNLEADPAESQIRAFLHRTVGVPEEELTDLRPTRISVRRADGLTLELVENPIDDCVLLNEVLPDEVGVCFLADPAQTPSLRPGDVLEARVDLPGVVSLFGAVEVPEAFELLDLPETTCRIDPDSRLQIRWSRSYGAWAYINETLISGLADALQPEGIEADDPLYLLGLSISDQDTEIVFPSEFGVFNRFDLERDLAVRLQTGLPASTAAEITISAVERNYVNWVRGGNFNPSGRVRVPSLEGDGTGVFAATVNRRFRLFSAPAAGVAPDCAPTG